VRFNIAFMGPEGFFHLRRDFILLVKYSLEDLGHDVILSGLSLDPSRLNLLIGTYWLGSESIHRIARSGMPYAHINTEVIANDMLNHDPTKTDFLGAYLPSMDEGRFIWDVLMDNMPEHRRYGTNAHFLRWGSHPRMKDVERRKDKDLDYYFFGVLSDRRKRLLQSLGEAGLVGTAHGSCPYFLRNDCISRARVQLNLTQDERYKHVNPFRIGYLADNGCCTLTEPEHDPAHYLKYAEVIETEQLIESVRHFASTGRWKESGDRAETALSEQSMKHIMEQLLDQSFASVQ
jgi:hypothetical protein